MLDFVIKFMYDIITVREEPKPQKSTTKVLGGRSVYLKIKDDDGVELLPDQRAPGNLVTSLEAERDKLLARLAEIEEQLKALKK